MVARSVPPWFAPAKLSAHDQRIEQLDRVPIALVRTLSELPPMLRASVMWDLGPKMAPHLDIPQATGTKIYLRDAARP